jgi:arsenate reductase-like glutaredoxin family protein
MSTIIYTKPGCRYSEAARRDLEERGEPYEVRDILGAPPEVKELAGLSDGTLITPVIRQEDGVLRLGFGGV